MSAISKSHANVFYLFLYCLRSLSLGFPFSSSVSTLSLLVASRLSGSDSLFLFLVYIENHLCVHSCGVLERILGHHNYGYINGFLCAPNTLQDSTDNSSIDMVETS